MQGTEMDGGAALGSAGKNEELSFTISHHSLAIQHMAKTNFVFQ